MTAHELAKVLMELPDVPVQYEDKYLGNVEISFVWMAKTDHAPGFGQTEDDLRVVTVSRSDKRIRNDHERPDSAPRQAADDEWRTPAEGCGLL